MTSALRVRNHLPSAGSTRAPEEAGPVMLHAARALGRRAIVSQGWFDGSVANAA
jgi:hypothetical protein